MGVHDSFFKRVFGDPKHAAGLLRTTLPAALVEHLDLSRLAPKPSALPGARSEFRADLLFQTTLYKSLILIAILLEHQSTTPPAMPLRLLGYKVRVWEQHHAKHPKDPLPVIVSVVVSHDPRGFHAPVRFSELFAEQACSIPDLRALIPEFGFILQDISERSDGELQDAAIAALPKLALWAMRDARTPGRILETLGAWAKTLADVLNAEGGMDALTLIFRYIAEVEKSLNFEQLHEKLAELSPRTGDAVMTIAEQLRNEGRARGLKEGLEQGLEQAKREMLERQLQVKFGEVSLEEAQRIETASVQQLDTWFTRSITAKSRHEVWE